MILYFGENIKRMAREEKLLNVLTQYCEWRKTCYSPDEEGKSRFHFAFGARGKPYLPGKAEDGSPIHFSISHSGRFWICGVDDSSLGVDIEDLTIRRGADDRLSKIAKRFFTPQEAIFADTPERFYQVWTRKEAYIKYKGTGFSEGFSSFSTVDNNNQLVSKIGDAFLGEIEILDKNAYVREQITSAWCSAKQQTIEQISERGERYK